MLLVGMSLGPMISSLSVLIALWLLIGLGYSLTQTPAGRLLRRSANAVDRPALFAAQFSLSHACWLITYPLAGYSGTLLGLNATFFVMAGLSLLGIILAVRLWPADVAEIISHDHPDLAHDHPRLQQFGERGHAQDR